MCSGRGHVSIIGLRLCICSHTCPLLYICVGVLFWVHSYFVRICTYYVRVQVYLYVFCVRGHAYGVGKVVYGTDGSTICRYISNASV